MYIYTESHMFENHFLKNHEELVNLLENINEKILKYNFYNNNQLIYINFFVENLYIYQNIHAWCIDSTFITKTSSNIDSLSLLRYANINLDALTVCPHYEYLVDTTRDLLLPGRNGIQFDSNNPLFRTNNIPTMEHSNFDSISNNY